MALQIPHQGQVLRVAGEHGRMGEWVYGNMGEWTNGHIGDG